MPDYRTPGVYVEEIPVTGPIAGVGTSTAAFIGPALRGDIGFPSKITNWTQFTATFGGYITSPRRYLAHAVRGFFENGGTVAYITRIGTAKKASLKLADRAKPAGIALVVRAREEGPSGNSLKVEVRDEPPVPRTTLRAARVTGAAGEGAAITLPAATDAAEFRADDLIDVNGVHVQVARVRGNDIILTTALPAAVSDAAVRTADPQIGQRRFRVVQQKGIERGSVLRLTQGDTTDVVSVDQVNGDVITAESGLTKSFSLAEDADPVEITSAEFSLDVTGPGKVEQFNGLTMDPRHSRYFGRIVNSELVDVSLPEEPSTAPPPTNLPKPTGLAELKGGKPDDLTRIDGGAYDDALASLAKIDDVNLVCAPDAASTPGVQQKLLEHCEWLKDRFAILDSAETAQAFGTAEGSVLAHRAKMSSDRGYAALYYPWIRISEPAGSGTLLVPPSGHIAGIFARSDLERGVHKAPANEPIAGALGVQRVLDNVEQGELNVEGVNVLRVFTGGRPVVWGARTTAPAHQAAWRYVSVRRLFLFIEESIQEGLRWAVFEPNDLSLRKKLERTVTEFLSRIWAAGALFGATASEAFYVKIDDENNPPAIRELGQIVVEIGVAPVRPAEFIVVRIGMTPGGGQVQEG